MSVNTTDIRLKCRVVAESFRKDTPSSGAGHLRHHKIISIFLSVVGLQRQQVQERNTDLPLYNDTIQTLLGDPKVSPIQRRYSVLPESSGSALRPLLSGMYLKHL